jgi:hypothetical protein
VHTSAIVFKQTDHDRHEIQIPYGANGALAIDDEQTTQGGTEHRVRGVLHKHACQNRKVKKVNNKFMMKILQ